MSNFIASGDNINGQSVVIIEKFTPGPWKYRQQPNLDFGFYTETVDQSHNRTFIGEVGGGLQDAEEVEANAKLIAAAPELYAACKEFVRKVEAGEAKSTASYEQMKAAIKKATE